MTQTQKQYFEYNGNSKLKILKMIVRFFYNRWKMTDDINAFHIWQTQQALDSIKTKK